MHPTGEKPAEKCSRKQLCSRHRENGCFHEHRRIEGRRLEKALAQRLRELLANVAWLGNWETAREPLPFARGYDFKPTYPCLAKILWICGSCARLIHGLINFPKSRRRIIPDLKRLNPVRVFAAPRLSARRAFELTQRFLTCL